VLVQRRKDRTESIQRAAAEVFASVGYANATTADIAARAGLPAGSLHYHIISKEQLLFDVLTDGMRKARQRLERLINAPASAADRLYTYLKDVIRTNCERSNSGLTLNFFFLQSDFLEPENRLRYVAERDEYESLLRRAVQEGMDSGEFRPSNVALEIRLILGAVSWINIWYRAGGSLTAEEVAEWYARRLVENLMTTPKPLSIVTVPQD
jgi:AcrR family transcriptional regulator